MFVSVAACGDEGSRAWEDGSTEGGHWKRPTARISAVKVVNRRMVLDIRSEGALAMGDPRQAGQFAPADPRIQ